MTQDTPSKCTAICSRHGQQCRARAEVNGLCGHHVRRARRQANNTLLEVPKLGSPERPSEGVDTSKPWADCKYCGAAIFDGEGNYASAPAHWACYEKIMKAPDEIESKLAGLRDLLKKL